MKKFLIFVMLCAMALVLSSCSNYLNSSDDFYGGDVVDAEMLSSIAESVFSSDESLRPEETTTLVEGDLVYGEDETTEADPSGDNVENGGEETTTAEKTAEGDPEEETTKRYHDGTYYWTESGKVYHKWADCGHLKNSSEVFSGSALDAEAAGKETLCSLCAKK